MHLRRVGDLLLIYIGKCLANMKKVLYTSFCNIWPSCKRCGSLTPSLQAAEGERAAAEEAAELLQQRAREEGEEGGAEGAGPELGDEKRMVMQAMHVPHQAGKSPPVCSPLYHCLMPCA